MPGSLTHLARRFLDVASSKPLSASERAAVAEWLEEPLADLFFDQPAYDQRHGYHAASSVVAWGHDEPDVVIAALLHDIGKRHSGLGLIGRSLGSVLIMARLPLPEPVLAYRDHGIVGARELSHAGAPPLAIDFALHHHGERPRTISPDIWDVLVTADQPPNTRHGAGWRISSGGQ